MSEGKAQISQLVFGKESRGWFRRGFAYVLFVGLPLVVSASLIGPTPHLRLVGLACFYLPFVVTMATGKTWPMYAGYGGTIAALIFFAPTELVMFAGLYLWPALGSGMLAWLFWDAMYSRAKFWEITESASAALMELIKKAPAPQINIDTDNDGPPQKKGVEWGGANRSADDMPLNEYEADLLREQTRDSAYEKMLAWSGKQRKNYIRDQEIKAEQAAAQKQQPQT
jgi:hypothetical protein